MRYTRSKQVEKVNPYMQGAGNVPITYMHEKKVEIDKTFKWHRDFEESKNDNVIEFGRDECTYGTCFKAKTKCWCI